MNMERFRMVVDRIKVHPDSFDMGYWHVSEDVRLDRDPSLPHDCGTTHCLAGHAHLLMLGLPVNASIADIKARWSKQYFPELVDMVHSDECTLLLQHGDAIAVSDEARDWLEMTEKESLLFWNGDITIADLEHIAEHGLTEYDCRNTMY